MLSKPDTDRKSTATNMTVIATRNMVAITGATAWASLLHDHIFLLFRGISSEGGFGGAHY